MGKYKNLVKQKIINELPIIFDYTIESGVWYKYGVQKIDTDGVRSKMNQTGMVMRNFNYSFLLGQNNQQLKLMFDNTMNSFKIQMQESKIDPIGANYPIITRNASSKYRIIPINSLISFWMDENNLFCNKKDIYQYDDVLDEYELYKWLYLWKRF